MNEIQNFKDDYVGRIVISTGKIKTHVPSNPGGWEIKEIKKAFVLKMRTPL
jgi:hypothetical protein